MKGGKGIAVSTTVIIGVLVLVIAGMAVYIFMGRREVPEEKELRNVLVREDNVDEVRESITSPPKNAGSYTVTMNSDWHFPDGSSPSTDAYVGNSKTNSWPVWFEVTLSTGETVFESPILPVDSYVRNFALDTDLDEGTYGATITYHLVDEEQNELSTLSIGLTIFVEG